MPMSSCSACGNEYEEAMFTGSAGWLSERPHLHLQRVCLSCRARTIECKGCGLEYPAVPRYFYRRTRKGKPAGRYGLRSECKVCFSTKVSEARLKRREDDRHRGTPARRL
jgi:adenine-specific DNA methylase